MLRFPKRLLDGYNDFMGGRYLDERDRYKALAEQGQKPQTLVIACCDSRKPSSIVDRVNCS
jgi:carbonic anhydrase